MSKWLINLVVCAALMTLGCAEKGKPVSPKSDKQISKAAPQKVVAQTPGAAKPSSRPTSRPTGQPRKLPAGHPPMGGPSVAAPPLTKGGSTGRPTSAPTSKPMPANIAKPGIIKGRVEITEELRSKVKPGTTLFISVRRFEGKGKRGMIMAAKKFPVGNASIFPIDFTVTPRDVMMGGTKLAGPVTVAARLDQDGDAISKQPGDLEGEHKGAILVGKDRASIMLNVLRQ